MIAILYSADPCAWAGRMGDTPWPLLPVASRPLIDYWLGMCVVEGIRKVQIVLGEDAKQIEDFAGAGERWSLEIEYVFARSSETPDQYLQNIRDHVSDGVLFLGSPFFLRRRKAFTPESFQDLPACMYTDEGRIAFLCAKTAAEMEALLSGGAGDSRGLEAIHIHPYIIDGIASYFDLNMKMVATEYPRYMQAGVSGGEDGSSIGRNVRTPPSCELQAPIIIGNTCSFGMMTTVGPNAVVADHVIVDSHSELSDCLVLSDTYIGRNLEIRNKIVSGNRVIDPRDGTVVEIDDSWLVARNRPDMRSEDFVRYVVLWTVALGVTLLQALPFLVLYPLLLITRTASYTLEQFHDPRTGYISVPVYYKRKNRKSALYRLFRGLSLDRFPWLLLVLKGRLFLCGQPPMRHPGDDELIKQLPHYYPGAFGYQDYNRDSDRLSDSLWYAHSRSLYEDLKILTKSLVYRFMTAGRNGKPK